MADLHGPLTRLATAIRRHDSDDVVLTDEQHVRKCRCPTPDVLWRATDLGGSALTIHGVHARLKRSTTRVAEDATRVSRDSRPACPLRGVAVQPCKVRSGSTTATERSLPGRPGPNCSRVSRGAAVASQRPLGDACRTPVAAAQRACGSDLSLLGDLVRVVDFDSKVSSSDFRVCTPLRP